MYLQQLTLQHVRLIEQLALSFVDRDGVPRMFTVLLAENGHAKTTVLQAIALAAAGVQGANKLVSDAGSFFDKRLTMEDGAPKALPPCGIHASFQVDARQPIDAATRQYDFTGSIDAWLRLPPGWKQFDGLSKLDSTLVRLRPHVFLDGARASDAPGWFVAAYGTARALPLPNAAAEPGNRSIDRLQSLFRPGSLLATGFVDVLARLHGPTMARDYARTLRDVLVGNDTLPGLLPADGPVRLKDLELRGQGGVRGTSDLVEAERIVLGFENAEPIKVPAVWLSAGYQSTLAWVSDLLGQMALDEGRVVPPQEMQGLVLLDEIDQHLHPRWQAALVPALKKTFPRMQFVATTHSPMILPGLAPGEVVMLHADARGSITATVPEEDPRLLTAAQLYREFFGMPDLFPSEVGRQLRRYGLLAGVAARSNAEEDEVQRLYRALVAQGVEVWEPVPREQSA
jgi:predicted ATPase